MTNGRGQTLRITDAIMAKYGRRQVHPRKSDGKKTDKYGDPLPQDDPQGINAMMSNITQAAAARDHYVDPQAEADAEETPDETHARILKQMSKSDLQRQSRNSQR